MSKATRLFPSMFAVACTLGLAACAESGTSTPNEPAATAPAPATPVAPASSDRTDALTGVAVCDDFLAAYEQCVTSKAPAEVRDQLNVGMAQWRSSWKTMADNAATRDSLPQMCQQARDASTAALRAYGCEL